MVFCPAVQKIDQTVDFRYLVEQDKLHACSSGSSPIRKLTLMDKSDASDSRI